MRENNYDTLDLYESITTLLETDIIRFHINTPTYLGNEFEFIPYEHIYYIGCFTIYVEGWVDYIFETHQTGYIETLHKQIKIEAWDSLIINDVELTSYLNNIIRYNV